MTVTISTLDVSDQALLQEIQSLNRNIFDEAIHSPKNANLSSAEGAKSSLASSTADSRFSSSALWSDHLLHDQGRIYYAQQTDDLVAFLFVYRKSWPSALLPVNSNSNTAALPDASNAVDNAKTTWHIWLCGVKTQVRGQDLLGRLFEHARQDCTLNRKEGEGQDLWSVRTVEKTFASMASWLRKTGWTKISEDSRGKSTWMWQKQSSST